MKIIIPVDTDELDEAKIVLISEASFWLYFEMDGGKSTNEKFFKTYEEIEEIDIVIVKNQSEYVWPFMEKNISVLVTSSQLYFEDIVEGYIFKELYDLNI
jgi:hypothetical protein